MINSLCCLNDSINCLDMRSRLNSLLSINNITNSIMDITFLNDISLSNHPVFRNNMISSFNIRISYFLLNRNDGDHRDNWGTWINNRLHSMNDGWWDSWSDYRWNHLSLAGCRCRKNYVVYRYYRMCKSGYWLSVSCYGCKNRSWV